MIIISLILVASSCMVHSRPQFPFGGSPISIGASPMGHSQIGMGGGSPFGSTGFGNFPMAGHSFGSPFGSSGTPFGASRPGAAAHAPIQPPPRQNHNHGAPASPPAPAPQSAHAPVSPSAHAPAPSSHSAAPGTTGYHRDTDDVGAVHGAHMKQETKEFTEGSAVSSSSAQGSQGSDTNQVAATIRSKGASHSTGTRVSKTETVGEQWDDKNVWDDTVDQVQVNHKQGSQGSASALQAVGGSEGSASKMEASDVDTVNASSTHTEGHTH